MTQFDLNDDDVIAMPSGRSPAGPSITKWIDQRQALERTLGSYAKEWFGEGVSCEVLKTTGGGWQKVKIRYRLEIVLDESEQ